MRLEFVKLLFQVFVFLVVNFVFIDIGLFLIGIIVFRLALLT